MADHLPPAALQYELFNLLKNRKNSRQNRQEGNKSPAVLPGFDLAACFFAFFNQIESISKSSARKKAFPMERSRPDGLDKRSKRRSLFPRQTPNTKMFGVFILLRSLPFGCFSQKLDHSLSRGEGLAVPAPDDAYGGHLHLLQREPCHAGFCVGNVLRKKSADNTSRHMTR